MRWLALYLFVALSIAPAASGDVYSPLEVRVLGTHHVDKKGIRVFSREVLRDDYVARPALDLSLAVRQARHVDPELSARLEYLQMLRIPDFFRETVDAAVRRRENNNMDWTAVGTSELGLSPFIDNINPENPYYGFSDAATTLLDAFRLPEGEVARKNLPLYSFALLVALEKVSAFAGEDPRSLAMEPVQDVLRQIQASYPPPAFIRDNISAEVLRRIRLIQIRYPNPIPVPAIEDEEGLPLPHTLSARDFFRRRGLKEAANDNCVDWLR
jgi:hypothetical protein